MNQKLIIDRIPRRFNEGLFFGNGCIGCLLYVRGNSLRFSIDHMQLWEIRDTEEDAVEGTFFDFIQKPDRFHKEEYRKRNLFGTAHIYRTRLPGLGFDVIFPEEITKFYGEIAYETAEGRLRLVFQNGSTAECEVYIDSNQNILRFTTDAAAVLTEINGWEMEKQALHFLKKEWGYRNYETIMQDGIRHVIQPYGSSGAAVASLFKKQDDAGKTCIYLSLCAKAYDAGLDQMIQENALLLDTYSNHEAAFQAAHLMDWQQYYAKSHIELPDLELQSSYEAELYKLYANIREKTWPVPLSGVWNNDERMPSWYGDWHNDLNIEACYWPVYKTNHIELARSYVDYYGNCMPRFEERAFRLFGIRDAIHCPLMMGPDGYGAGGEWCYWNVLLGPELFIAVDFAWFYAFSRDKERLKTIIYPFIRKVLRLYQALAFLREDGYYHIPFTNTPELFRDGRMLVREDSTFSISSLHYLLKSMLEYAECLGEDAGDLEAFQKKLLPVKPTEKGFPLFPSVDLAESHRHFCHMFPVFPLGMDIHGETAVKSLETIIDNGCLEYASWSFPYLSILASRCGRGNMAVQFLKLYTSAFRARNTFAVNGDPNRTGILRVSETSAGASADAFTLEAGLIAAAACCEMFVHRSAGHVYIAYGIPEEWGACSCTSLTIEGGHQVSIVISDYIVKHVVILAACEEVLTFHIAKYADAYLFEGKRLDAPNEWMVEVKKGMAAKIEAI